MPITKHNLQTSGNSTKKSTLSVAGYSGSKPTVSVEKYFTIGEAAKFCEVKPHVLRYWEQEFEQLKPTKRRGNRRYYQGKDLDTVKLIRALLHDQGFTIEGARQQLASKGKRLRASVSSESAAGADGRYKQAVKDIIADLQSILDSRS